jgi:hypothetical protein
VARCADLGVHAACGREQCAGFVRTLELRQTRAFLEDLRLEEAATRLADELLRPLEMGADLLRRVDTGIRPSFLKRRFLRAGR